MMINILTIFDKLSLVKFNAVGKLLSSNFLSVITLTTFLLLTFYHLEFLLPMFLIQHLD